MVEPTIRGYSSLEEAMSRLQQASLLAVDLETVSLDDHTAIGIGIYWGDNTGAYFPIFPTQCEWLPRVLGKIADKETTKLYHNGIGFDLEVLEKLAHDEGFDPPDDVNIEDSSIMAQVSGLPTSLQRLGEEWLGAGDLFSIGDLFSESGTRDMLGVPVERVAEKCLNDCRTTWRLYHELNGTGGAIQATSVDGGVYHQLNGTGGGGSQGLYGIAPLTPAQRDCYEVDRKLIHILRAVSRRGLGLRQGVLEEYERDLRKGVLLFERECDALGFNPGSPQQVGFVLASRGNILPFTDRTQKRLSTSNEVLEDCEDELAAGVLEYRHRAKLLTSYVTPWLGMERAYTHFRLDLATGRLASGRINRTDRVNRNLQNVPPDFRQVFRPDSGLWTWADYSQIELRVLAFMSQDGAMMEEYAKEEPDLHTATMLVARNYVPGFTRDNGKTFNFARVFGAGNRKLSRSTRVPLDKVPLVRAAMSEAYPESDRWIKSMMYNHGETVDTLFGRRCRLPEIKEGVDYNPRAFKGHVDKCAVNYPVQGTAADIVKRGMIKVFDSGVDLRLQVHDEWLVDGNWDPPEELAHIHPELHTPFETKKGLVWS